MKKFKKLILVKDTTFGESIEVEKSITCKDNERFSLKVIGNIDAWYINAGNIDAGNIDAGDIDAGNINAGDINAGYIDAGNINAGDINAGDINAGNIDAWDIICEKRIKKETKCKTIARIFIQAKSKLQRKEW